MILHRLFFAWRYLIGQTPWDTQVTPPELLQLVETENFSRGRALDLGCGTGTNAIYLAQHGYAVLGIDFVPQAIRTARRKAAAARVNVEFRQADVLAPGPVAAPFDLILDIGCFHNLDQPARVRYADNAKRWTHSGSILLLYSFFPYRFRSRTVGVARAEIEQLFAPEYNLLHYADDERSAWYRFQRR